MSVSVKSKLAAGGVAAVFLGVVGVMPAATYLSVENDVEFTVEKTWSKRTGNQERYMARVTMPNGESEVFEVTDSLLMMRFDSADDWSLLEEGKTYKSDVNWFRLGFLSMNRNLLDPQPVETPASNDAPQVVKPAAPTPN